MRMARVASVTVGQGSARRGSAIGRSDRPLVFGETSRSYAELADGAWTVARGLHALWRRARCDHVARSDAQLL